MNFTLTELLLINDAICQKKRRAKSKKRQKNYTDILMKLGNEFYRLALRGEHGH